MKNKFNIFLFLAVFCLAGVFSLYAVTEAEDGELRFPIAKNTSGTLEDKEQSASPIDLRDPDNIRTEVEYDGENDTYIVHTKVGDDELEAPFVFTSDEYKNYSLQKSMQNYWRDRNGIETADKHKGFSLSDIHVDIGRADEIFGPGGIQVKTQGSAEISMGLRRNRIQNPTLTERSQNPPPTFDFDEKIQLNVKGSVGDKIRLGLNYNTEASFDFDSEMIKLAYEGNEDEIIQSLEAGNVSMPLSGSLISGSSALFGLRTKLKFGRMTVDAVVSQQQSETQNVSVKNGAQTTDFEISVDEYDENRHFFLSQYFYENYNKALSSLPYINSSVKINRVEVWVTNKRGAYDQVRNIVAFADLGETEVFNAHWIPKSGARFPSNQSNNLYATVVSPDFTDGEYTIRDIDGVTVLLDEKLGMYGITGGEDYDKIENARMLSSSEYTLNPQLGYISLKAALNADEVLAVAYEFIANGTVYQVGEFASDVKTPNALVLKMLKGTSLHPASPTWKLMMKNIYSLGASQVQQDKFELDVMYQSDSTGLYLNYLPNSPIQDKTLLSAMGLDRLDSRNEAHPDGVYDFVSGVTIIPETGRIIFPTIEPFGSDLKRILGNSKEYEKYIYQELYDSTLVVAQEYSEKNKFRLKGKFKASSGSEIRLNAMNIPRGSVKVTAGGRTLTENVDYTVDYAMGTVNVINTDILDSGESINVSLESQSFFNTQRRSLFGMHLDYKFSDNFNLGATIMHMSEKPLTKKVEMGSEPISNTIWGLNGSYKTELPWLTNTLNKLPFFDLKAPSSFMLSGEFAQLIPGEAKVISGNAYIDDFESTKNGIDIRYPYNWKLASVPGDEKLFPESKKTNDLSVGYNRALLAWYTIDPLFTRNNSNTPKHIRSDSEQLSNHFVREVKEQEIYPNRETVYGQSSYRTILNLAYYPNERGPYNFDTDVDSEGNLNRPEKRWGGIMRKLETTDFEKANIEYIEFWLMDPFIYNPTAQGGELYFNLGDISEDILKDGKKFAENGIPAEEQSSVRIDTTVWGIVPKVQSLVSAFATEALERQDVGLNGLDSETEKQFYADYLTDLRAKLGAEAMQRMQDDPYSPFNDPAADKYHYFLGSDFDDVQLSILERYKHYNGTEGNSRTSGVQKAATSVPDVEDINTDNTLNEYERFYQYKIELRPGKMNVGENFINDKVVSEVSLANGSTDHVTWYQFKIPVSDYTEKIGNIRNFKSIRFIRMYMTNFSEETHLRFGSLELVRGEWRTCVKDLRYDVSEALISDGKLDVESVSIEENASKTPVNYVLPPGVDRVIDPSQTQLRQENEGAMSMKVTSLAPKDARAVYKKTGLDLRQYKKLKMFVHAERLEDDVTNLTDGDLALFVRLGSDHTNNFYEYEIPLVLTPAGYYSEEVSGDQRRVWPESNELDLLLSKLTDAKQKRNALGQKLTEIYSVYDKEDGKRQNKISVLGNPSLSEVKVIMIGIRNQSTSIKEGEIWVNELRMSEFEDDGGVAALANATLNMSDLAMFNFSGRMETSGFGSVEESVQQRNLDDEYQMSVATSVEFGKFFPEKAKVHIPLYYSYSREVIKPKYDPTNQDLELKDVLRDVSRSERDSVKKMSREMQVTRGVSLSNVKVDIQSKTPQLYDPTNFSLGYSFNETTNYNPETEYELTKNHKGYISYNFNTTPKPYQPFARMKGKSGYLKLIRDFNVNYMPSYISYINNINRYYYERQLRDLTGAGKIAPSFSQDFTWDRNFDMKYDFSRSLKFTFSTATNSRIDEPYVVVNKDLYPDEYERWKDSIWHGFKHGGRPLQYEQMFTVTYNVPINKIPALDWVTANAQYKSTYEWDRGVQAKDADGNSFSLGNTATNIMNWQTDGRLNFETLYKHSKYLKEVNSKFAKTARTRPTAKGQQKYSQTVSLKSGEPLDVTHGLKTNSVKLTATDANGRTYTLNYKVVDDNTIRIKPKRNVENLSLTIEKGEKSQEKTPTDYLSRVLMLVRNASATYKESRNLILPQYQPTTGFLGQRNTDGVKAPGYNYVFGFFRTDPYIDRAYKRGWLGADSIGDPVTINTSTDFQARINLEPLPGFKIELSGYRTTSGSRSVLFDGAGNTVETFSGTFSMTQVAIGTSFWKMGKTGNFDSDAFNDFKAYRAVVADRIRQKYLDAGYDIGEYDQSSSEVLIPSFLAAYTKRSASKVGLNIFPAIAKVLPNWKISCDALSKISAVKKYFKTITLSHGYRCVYNVASYSSFLDWEKGPSSDLGFRKSVVDGDSQVKIPSSMYDVNSVTLTESFNPLFGVNMTTLSNVSFKLEYKKTRTLNMNIASLQLVEGNNREWVVGAGYKFDDFNAVLKLKQQQTKVKNSLTLRTDFSIKDIRSVIRKLEEGYSEPESGGKTFKFSFTAEYVLSEFVDLCFYLDKNTNKPFVSSSYPTRSWDGGFTVRLMLTR